jgi:Tol biopolymer transport system component/predicted Ser/Thr protein kinase
MPLASRTRLGAYEVSSLIGAGGMGEVYKARDTRLERIVAIKVLPAHVAGAPEARQRFEREARAVAALNHPNICALYDVGRDQDVDFLVMEYVEGETLAQRLAGSGLKTEGAGGLPVDQALRYAVEMAGALAAAHRAGIAHRDLKPSNVMVTKAGVKLLDFGLAKTLGTRGGLPSDLSAAPTMSASDLTGQGILLGTLQYMAPEQLAGADADARTDIFAFGAVLYEMLTGQRAFTGKNQASLIGAIMHAEPRPVSTLQPLIPPALDRIVQKCLAKDPDERWQSAKDLHDELKWIGSSQTVATPEPTVRGAGTRVHLAWLATAVVTAALAGIGVFFFTRPQVEPLATIRFQVSPPEGTTFPGSIAVGVALSPDGRRVVFPATVRRNNAQVVMLAVRSLDTFEPQILPGTEMAGVASSLFWSPDSRFIGFFAQGKLKKVDVTGGAPQELCDAAAGGGGTWNRDGVIVFAPTPTSGLFRVSAAGGTPVPLTTLDASRQERSHLHPWFLPDGRHFLYVSVGLSFGALPNQLNSTATTASPTRAYVGSIDSTDRVELFESDSKVLYAADHLLFMRKDTLLAQPFDTAGLMTTGEPFPVAQNVSVNSANAQASFSASATGMLIYRPTDTGEPSQLAWFDRAGRQLATVGDRIDQLNVELSPDEKRVAVSVFDPARNSRDIHIYDLGRDGLRTRFTFDAADEVSVIWSPDGSQLIFNSNRKRTLEIYRKAATGLGDEELLFSNASNNSYPTSWSSDGRFILYTNGSVGSSTLQDLWALPLMGDRKPLAVVQTPFVETTGRISPDGRWVAYQSNESGGRTEVFVVPFSTNGQTSTPAPSGSKWQVSTTGGSTPRWRRDGKEIFFLSADNRLMAAAVNGEGSAFEVGAVRPLFEIHHRLVGYGGFFGYTYDVSADGQRFLVNTVTDRPAPVPMTVVTNWIATIRK